VILLGNGDEISLQPAFLKQNKTKQKAISQLGKNNCSM